MCASIALIPPGAEGAPRGCLLEKPKTAATPGQYWLHLNDWLANRTCWVLRARIEPAQAKGSASAQAARNAARAPGATPARATADADAAANALPMRTDLPAQPAIQDDGGKDASRAGERAEQNLSDRAQQKTRPPPTARALEAPAALARSGELPATSAFAAQTFATQIFPAPTSPAPPSPAQPSSAQPLPAQAQRPNQRASIESTAETVFAIPATATKARATGAATSLQFLLLAVFCGPALYLFAAGTIRRLRPAEAAHGPPPSSAWTMRPPIAPYWRRGWNRTKTSYRLKRAAAQVAVSVSARRHDWVRELRRGAARGSNLRKRAYSASARALTESAETGFLSSGL
jgi:hypothetical protein